MFMDQSDTCVLTYDTKYNYDYECSAAVTNCKAGYYGTGDSDPFISKQPCLRIDDYKGTRYYPRCELRKHRVKSPEFKTKIKEDFSSSEYFKEEYIEDKKCDKCNFKGCIKKIYLWNLPKYIIIHLQKFDNNGRKINKHIHYYEMSI